MNWSGGFAGTASSDFLRQVYYHGLPQFKSQQICPLPGTRLLAFGSIDELVPFVLRQAGVDVDLRLRNGPQLISTSYKIPFLVDVEALAIHRKVFVRSR